MRIALVALLAVGLSAPVARADVRLPPPPPPPPPSTQGETVAKIAVGSATGFAVMGLGLWLARRRTRALVAP